MHLTFAGNKNQLYLFFFFSLEILYINLQWIVFFSLSHALTLPSVGVKNNSAQKWNKLRCWWCFSFSISAQNDKRNRYTISQKVINLSQIYTTLLHIMLRLFWHCTAADAAAETLCFFSASVRKLKNYLFYLCFC